MGINCLSLNWLFGISYINSINRICPEDVTAPRVEIFREATMEVGLWESRRHFLAMESLGKQKCCFF